MIPSASAFVCWLPAKSGRRSSREGDRALPALVAARSSKLDWRTTKRKSSVSSRVPMKGLPRKEVIQPQLPLRLPCYDFTPVTGPTFDGSLPEG